MRPFGKPKAKPSELMLKVDNIVPSWRSMIPNWLLFDILMFSVQYLSSVHNFFSMGLLIEVKNGCSLYLLGWFLLRKNPS